MCVCVLVKVRGAAEFTVIPDVCCLKWIQQHGPGKKAEYRPQGPILTSVYTQVTCVTMCVPLIAAEGTHS